ncbi:unnamed protein product [Brachionus calyciflorus]|uniref:RRM domain-containing protein n=1 Tax=Brachionus calyciflorus TaxID=104777 RepID=A0A814DY33_9BILA|nr:unnamed protein product [Brachionus calyciflorus]
MKSKHDSSSDSRDSASNGAGKNDDSMSESGDHSRSRSRSRSRSNSPSSKKDRSAKDHDALSIYIGNVDYGATEDDLKDAFICCGDIVRVTIIKNMKTGHPKGAAFIEFIDKQGVQSALKMNGVEVKGRPLSVTNKKPKPEKKPRRDRRSDSSYLYERRSSRSASSYYMSPYGSRSPYGPPSRGYYDMPPHMESRRGHPPSMHHMPIDQPRMSRYDPYRRPEFYDPYMMPRGGPSSHLPPPPPYYHHPDKYSSGHHSSRSSQPPQRYSNPFSRR